ncbi:MAG: hypothetical protein AABZ30_00620, partial [Myxococcota bacterium]
MTRRSLAIFATLALLALLVVSCRAAAPRAPDPRALDVAARAIDAVLRERPGDLAARRDRGWVAYLQGDTARARVLIEGASDQGDALALAAAAGMAQDGARFTDARRLWLRLLESAAPGDAWTPTLALYATHRLNALLGEAPGDSGEILPVVTRLAARRLGPQARAGLAAILGRLAEQAGDDGAMRLALRALGCPDHWRVAGPSGRLPRVDLDAASFRPAADSIVTTRGCRVSLDSSDGRAGVFEASLRVDSARAQRALLWVESGDPWRVLGHDHASPDRPQARTVWLEVALPAGRSRLALRFGAGSGSHFQAGLLAHDGSALPPILASIHAGGGVVADPPVRALGVVDPAAPPAAPPAGSALPGAAIARFLSAHAALRRGDDTARALIEPLLAMAPRFAPALLLSAAIDAGDPSLPRSIARDRARRALERAVTGCLSPRGGTCDHENAPARAVYELAVLDHQDDKDDRALERIALGRRLAPGSFRWDLLAWRVFERRGWEVEATQALARAERANPESCEVREAVLEDARAPMRGPDAVLAAARRLGDCDAREDAWAELLRRRGRLAEAAREL